MVEVWCFGSEDSRCWILELMCEWNAYPGIGSGHIKSKCKTPPRLRDKTPRGNKLHIVQKCKLYSIGYCYRYGGCIDKKHRLRLDFLIWIEDLIYFNCQTISGVRHVVKFNHIQLKSIKNPSKLDLF